MEDLEEAVGRHAGMMTHQEIIRQYFKVFGRDMTKAERDAFFLSNRETLPYKDPQRGAAGILL
jgi:hypothetical protein